MPIGPGKYDDLCTLVREKAHAGGVLLIIFGGDKGDSFSVQADLITTLRVPDILEETARSIRKDLQGAKQ